MDKKNYNDFSSLDKVKKSDIIIKKDKIKNEQKYYNNSEFKNNKQNINKTYNPFNEKDKTGFNFDQNIIKPLTTQNINIQESSLLFTILDQYNEKPMTSNSFNEKDKTGFNFDQKSMPPITKQSINNQDSSLLFTNSDQFNEKPNEIIDDKKNLQQSSNSPKILEKNTNTNLNENKNDNNTPNLDTNNIEENKNQQIFNFDNNTITPCLMKEENIQQLSIFPIFKEFLNKAKQIISINSNGLIMEKMIKEIKKEPLIDLVFDSYKDKILLPVNKNTPINKSNIKEDNLDEIEKINDLFEGNVVINIFEKKENEMICQKPTIIIKDKIIETNINNFQEIINSKNTLFNRNFVFENNIINKLNLNINENNINLNSSYPNNSIIPLYREKYIRYFSESSDKISKINFVEIEENDNNNFNSISAINQRNINKIKFTRILEKSNIDNNKINFDYYDIINNINEIDKIYESTNIKSFSIQNDIINQEINIDDEMENIITEINYTFIPDEIISRKITLDDIDIPIDDSIEKIYSNYSQNYIKNIRLNNNYTKKSDIDIFDDIDIGNIYDKFKKYKNKRIKKKKKYLCSGEASIELMKTNLINDKYNNTETSILHNLSIKLNEINNINNISDNYEIGKITNISLNNSRNSKNLKCAKKLKNEINHSVMNKFFRNKSELINRKNSEISNNNISLNKSEKNYIMKQNTYQNIMEKIKKSNDNMNKKEKKMYINKLKIQQENKFDEEIKRKKRYKLLFPIFLVIIPLFITYYNKFMEE